MAEMTVREFVEAISRDRYNAEDIEVSIYKFIDCYVKEERAKIASRVHDLMKRLGATCRREVIAAIEKED